MKHTNSNLRVYRSTPAVVYIAGVLLAGGLLWGAFALFGWFTRPDLTLADPPAEAAAEALAARDIRFTQADRYSLHLEVPEAEYAAARAILQAGAAAHEPTQLEMARPSWFPRGESPILAAMVQDGQLPPVAERIGSEPVVMRGVDGIGRYGGTWLRIATSPGDVSALTWRLAGTSFTRFSPLGEPVVPHILRELEAQENGRIYILHFRRGARWSDGHPLTVNDFLFWWEHEIHSPTLGQTVPIFLRMGETPAIITKIDDFTAQIEFAEPNTLFPMQSALDSMRVLLPEHYLRQFHPDLGDPDFIQEQMQRHALSTPRALYSEIKSYLNPELPQLMPWIPVEYRTAPPYVFVRNPYYFVVDTEGNQLPYIDRIQFDIQDRKMLTVAAANGKVSMQARHISFEQYTELMSRREAANTRVLLWYSIERSDFAINPNLNRRIDPREPATRWKAELLGSKFFRQALSLAIDRAAIIRSYYHGTTTPSQVEPGVESPFHAPQLANAFITYEPARANQLLDDLWRSLGADPTPRDADGMRLFPDGTRMTFYLDVTPFTGVGPAQFIVDDWAAVGIRTILRERERSLFYLEKNSRNFDFNVWIGASEYYPLLSPRYFIATSTESFYATGWGNWFTRGGLYNTNPPDAGASVPVPSDHPMYEAMLMYERAIRTPDVEMQKQLFWKMADIVAENLWTINISTPPPQPVVVDADMRNVPHLAQYGWKNAAPANAGIETYFFAQQETSPGAVTYIRDGLLAPAPMARSAAMEGSNRSAAILARLIRLTLLSIAGLFLIAIAIRHPFVTHRLLLMIPTLFIISVCTFIIIQLPPGDFLTSRIIQLEEAGGDPEIVRQEIESLRQMFHFDEPVWKRYLRWTGLYWFTSFDPTDKGLLQGEMGRSMETTRSVNVMVGDRLLLTVLISLGTILFTWSLAIPIGIYSAVRQHTISDYVITIIGFLGMCIPPFLLALILMTMANVSGLFSTEFQVQPEWNLPKVLDLLKHIWVPIVVMGLGGTASMIRVMRANLLDELKKPYVTTARAKGVRPMRLLFKYPVRIALNPFISGIGGLFPQLISGGTIVAVVLALPTVGPLLLSALFSQDMNLAGSLLMLLSLLGVAGTLVSDLLLLWVDPRIRMEGGSK